jgi:hypothetical protein
MISNLVPHVKSPMVLNIGRSLRFIIVELNRLINLGLGTNCMPPNSSETILQKTSMFIWGEKTGSVKSRSRSLTYSTFPFKLPTTLTRGSQGSFGTMSLDMVPRLHVALDIVGSGYDQILRQNKDLVVTTTGFMVSQAFSLYKIQKLLSYLKIMRSTANSQSLLLKISWKV